MYYDTTCTTTTVVVVYDTVIVQSIARPIWYINRGPSGSCATACCMLFVCLACVIRGYEKIDRLHPAYSAGTRVTLHSMINTPHSKKYQRHTVCGRTCASVRSHTLPRDILQHKRVRFVKKYCTMGHHANKGERPRSPTRLPRTSSCKKLECVDTASCTLTTR